MMNSVMSANLDVEREFLFCLGVTIGSVLSGFTYSPSKFFDMIALLIDIGGEKFFYMSPLIWFNLYTKLKKHIEESST